MIFIFPTELEAAKFRTVRPDANIHICGVGMAESGAYVAKLVSEGDRTEHYVLAGIAGAYNIENNPVDQVVEVVEEHIAEIPEVYAKSYPVKPYFGLTPARSNTTNGINLPSGGADIENMEGAAVAAVCAIFGVRFSEIRGVSNDVNQPMEDWSDISAVNALTEVLIKIYDQQ